MRPAPDASARMLRERASRQLCAAGQPHLVPGRDGDKGLNGRLTARWAKCALSESVLVS